MPDKRRVYIAGSLPDAHIVKAMLEEQGIPTLVYGEHTSGLSGELPFDADTGVSVWVVSEKDLAKAEKLVDDYIKDRKTTHKDPSPWTCSKCGEKIEGAFSACWKCGTERN